MRLKSSVGWQTSRRDSPFLVEAGLELVVECLGAVKVFCVLPLLEDHQVEKVLELGHFERFEASLLPHELHKGIDVLESAQNLGHKQLSSRLHYSVRLNDEVREVGAHQAQGKDPGVYAFRIERHVRDVSLDNVISALAHVEGVDLTLMPILFQLKLEFSFPAAEVSDHGIQILGPFQLSHDHIKRVFVPFLHLIPVALVVL